MTWRRAAAYWLGFALLAAYYLAVEREPAGPAAAHLTRAAFLDIPSDQIHGLDIQRPDRTIRCRRVGDRWQLVEPAGRAVPADLIAALVNNLTQLPDVEVIAETAANPAQFGLDTPLSQITLTRSSGRPIIIRLGTRNPSGTAVYAQRDDSARVYLIGLNVRYYEELLFEAVGNESIAHP